MTPEEFRNILEEKTISMIKDYKKSEFVYKIINSLCIKFVGRIDTLTKREINKELKHSIKELENAKTEK